MTCTKIKGSSNDLSIYFLDSGASSHFTPYLEYIINTSTCSRKFILADSIIVHATQKEEIKIVFTKDQGKQCKLKLLRVIYIPGLNRKLFSIPDFVRDSKFNIPFLINLTRFDFGDGTTFIIPVNRLENISMEAIHTVEKEE